MILNFQSFLNGKEAAVEVSCLLVCFIDEDIGSLSETDQRTRMSSRIRRTG